jgi:hypothetical protein
MKHTGEHRRIALPSIPEDIPDIAHGCTATTAQPPRKIHPEMFEHLDLLGRLERLELLERLAHNSMKERGLVARAHEEEDYAVSTASITISSSLRVPTYDREHLEDGHAPPSEQVQARWASASAAGVAV